MCPLVPETLVWAGHVGRAADQEIPKALVPPPLVYGLPGGGGEAEAGHSQSRWRKAGSWQECRSHREGQTKVSGTQGRLQLLQKPRRTPLPFTGWQPFLSESPWLRLKRVSLPDPQDHQAGRESGHEELSLERGGLCLPRSPQRPLTVGTSVPWGGLTGARGHHQRSPSLLQLLGGNLEGFTSHLQPRGAPGRWTPQGPLWCTM